MSLKNVSVFVLITLLLAACSATATPTAVSQGNETPVPSQVISPTQKTAPTQPGNPYSYPAPGSLPTEDPSLAYPAPGSTGNGANNIPASGYEPLATDSSLQRD